MFQHTTTTTTRMSVYLITEIVNVRKRVCAQNNN